MKKDRMAWVVGGAVVGAFILLICAWVFFFWLAANNRVADVPLETSGDVRQTGTGTAAMANEKLTGGQSSQQQTQAGIAANAEGEPPQ